jgi:hypothetical protein
MYILLAFSTNNKNFYPIDCRAETNKVIHDAYAAMKRDRPGEISANWGHQTSTGTPCVCFAPKSYVRVTPTCLGSGRGFAAFDDLLVGSSNVGVGCSIVLADS